MGDWTNWPAERCTCVEGRIGLCGACTIYMMHGGPKPLPRFEDFDDEDEA